MRVLVVEDNDLIARGIVAGLQTHGMTGITADAVDTMTAAETALATGHCDALVLDLRLPDADGMVLLKRLRNSRSTLPILILTALADVFLACNLPSPYCGKWHSGRRFAASAC